jgi:hypothetical protein
MDTYPVNSRLVGVPLKLARQLSNAKQQFYYARTWQRLQKHITKQIASGGYVDITTRSFVRPVNRRVKIIEVADVIFSKEPPNG